MLRVFTALGKQMPKDKAMVEDVERVAQLLAKYNCTMVQGGAKTGLMGVAVQEFQKYSDEVVMIVPEVHKSDLVGTKNKEFYIVEGESDRMRITIHTCDMMIVFPGGSGTLAELAYYNETRKSGEHQARIVVVNTHGFFNKLFKFQKHQIKHGFMKPEHVMFDVIKNADELETIIQEVITAKQEKLQKEELEAEKAKVEEKSTKKRGRKPSTKKTGTSTKKVKPAKVEKNIEDVSKVEKVNNEDVDNQLVVNKEETPVEDKSTKTTAKKSTSTKKTSTANKSTTKSATTKSATAKSSSAKKSTTVKSNGAKKSTKSTSATKKTAKENK